MSTGEMSYVAHDVSTEYEDGSKALLFASDQLLSRSQNRVIPTRFYVGSKVDDMQTFATRRHDASDITEVFSITDTHDAANKTAFYHKRSYAVKILDDPRGQLLIRYSEEVGVAASIKRGQDWQKLAKNVTEDIAGELEHRISDALSRVALRDDMARVAADYDALFTLRVSDQFLSQHLAETDRQLDRLYAQVQKIGGKASEEYAPLMLQLA